MIFSFSAKAEDFEGQSLALLCLGYNGNTVINIIFGLNQDYIYLNLMIINKIRKHYLVRSLSYSNDQLMLLLNFSTVKKGDKRIH